MQEITTYQQLLDNYQDSTDYLFDMDGTIMNTEVIHAMAINMIIKEESGQEIELQELEDICIGLTDEIVYEKLIRSQHFVSITLHDFLRVKKVFFKDILQTVEKEKIFDEKIRNLLEEMVKNNKKVALVTSSERETTELLLTHLNLKHYFNLIVTREDTPLNKPNPAPYLYAMEKLNTNASQCLIFEDSNPGREAAIKSGGKLFKVDWYKG